MNYLNYQVYEYVHTWYVYTYVWQHYDALFALDSTAIHIYRNIATRVFIIIAVARTRRYIDRRCILRAVLPLKQVCCTSTPCVRRRYSVLQAAGCGAVVVVVGGAVGAVGAVVVVVVGAVDVVVVADVLL